MSHSLRTAGLSRPTLERETEGLTMKKTIAILAAAALLGACAKKDISPDEVRAAMPKPADIQVGSPKAANPGALTVEDAVTIPAEFALDSYYVALTFNLNSWAILTLVQVITAFPPTECTADQCTWGPWKDDNNAQVSWRMVVKRDGDGYSYVLGAHAAAATDFTPILSGHAFPGADGRHGQGDFVLDLDASKTVQPTKDDHGKLSVTYDNRTFLKLTALFTGAKNSDPAGPAYLDIAYDFEESATGGDLQFMFQGVGTSKNLSLATRWVTGGEGRGDAKYVETGASHTASQCWAGNAGGFVLEYQIVDAVTMVGSNDACAPFGTPVYSTLTLP